MKWEHYKKLITKPYQPRRTLQCEKYHIGPHHNTCYKYWPMISNYLDYIYSPIWPLCFPPLLATTLCNCRKDFLQELSSPIGPHFRSLLGKLHATCTLTDLTSFCPNRFFYRTLQLDNAGKIFPWCPQINWYWAKIYQGIFHKKNQHINNEYFCNFSSLFSKPLLLKVS